MKVAEKSARGSKTTSEQARKAAQARWAKTPIEGRSEAASRAANTRYTDEQRAAVKDRQSAIESKRRLPCRNCGKPRGSALRVTCGSDECFRAYASKRQGEFKRKYRAENGVSYKCRDRVTIECAGGCGRPVRKSVGGAPTATCRTCTRKSQRSRRWYLGEHKLAKAARGKPAPKNWAWCSGECRQLR